MLYADSIVWYRFQFVASAVHFQSTIDVLFAVSSRFADSTWTCDTAGTTISVAEEASGRQLPALRQHQARSMGPECLQQ